MAKELRIEQGIRDVTIARPMREVTDRINRLINPGSGDKIALGPNAEIVWSGDVVTIREVS